MWIIVESQGKTKDANSSKPENPTEVASAGQTADADKGATDPAIFFRELGIRLDPSSDSTRKPPSAKRTRRGDSGTFHWNGIGTIYYGERDYHPDRSYITTKWFIIFCIPIFPFLSRRVSYVGSSREGLPPIILSIIREYIYHGGPTRPHLKQKIYTYIYIIYLATWYFLILVFFNNIEKFSGSDTITYCIITFLWTIPALVPSALRLYAREKSS
jgi:hypothetical protein